MEVVFRIHLLQGDCPRLGVCRHGVRPAKCPKPMHLSVKRSRRFQIFTPNWLPKMACSPIDGCWALPNFSVVDFYRPAVALPP